LRAAGGALLCVRASTLWPGANAPTFFFFYVFVHARDLRCPLPRALPRRRTARAPLAWHTQSCVGCPREERRTEWGDRPVSAPPFSCGDDSTPSHGTLSLSDAPTPPPLATPLLCFCTHSTLPGKMVPFAGWSMPIQYTDSIMESTKHCRSDASLFDVSHMCGLTLKVSSAARARACVCERERIERA